jgi:hypothetical protein
MKKLNYKVGALKRKFKIKGDFEPGTLLSKVNENKALLKNLKKPLTKKQVAIMGLV